MPIQSQVFVAPTNKINVLNVRQLSREEESTIDNRVEEGRKTQSREEGEKKGDGDDGKKSREVSIYKEKEFFTRSILKIQLL